MADLFDAPQEAVAGIPDGATVMIGSFGTARQPVELIEAPLACRASDLVVINNTAGNGGSLAAPITAGQVRKIICPFPRQPDSRNLDNTHHAVEIELELVAQGNLTQRIRAAGAGIGAFYTPTGFGTLLADGNEQRVIDGKPYELESPIRADFALIVAFVADRLGNLVYRKTDLAEFSGDDRPAVARDLFGAGLDRLQEIVEIPLVDRTQPHGNPHVIFGGSTL